MSLKQRATVVENTGGQLKYLHSPVYNVDSNGLNIDFTDTEIFEFEDGRLKCSHLEIFNSGPDRCMVGFDTDYSTMDPECRDTFSLMIYPGKPYNYISLDGEADTMSLKTLTGTTATIEIIVW
jgi:hypothetical protein